MVALEFVSSMLRRYSHDENVPKELRGRLGGAKESNRSHEWLIV